MSQVIMYRKNTIDDMLSIVGMKDNDVCNVSETGRGGTFVYDKTKKNINDTGLILNGWVRDGTKGYAVPDWFGNDSYSVNKALNASLNIKCTKGKTYLVGNLNIRDGHTIDLNGCTLERDTTILYGDQVDGGWTNQRGLIYVTNNIKNIIIKNGFINNKHSKSSDSYRAFFIIDNGGSVDNLLMDNLIFLDDHAGLYVSNRSGTPGISNSLIKKCRIESPIKIDVGVATRDTINISYALCALQHAENVMIKDCFAFNTFHGAIAIADDNILPFVNNNIVAKNFTIKDTVDTSLYFYGSNCKMLHNNIHNPGKDGLKINTNLQVSSNYNILSKNTITGCPAQHQADGGSMCVLVGSKNIFVNNVINMYGVPGQSVNVVGISVDGHNTKINGNNIDSIDGSYSGIHLYSFINTIEERTGVSIINNTFNTLGSAINIDQDSHTEFSIENNIFNTFSTGISMYVNPIQPDVRKPYFAIISNNKFIAKTKTAIHIYNKYTDRVTFNGNSFSGVGQRDVQTDNDVGAWIGYGNTSEHMNDPVYYAYTATSRGINSRNVPTTGTYKKGEIVCGESTGYKCLTSGTMGSISDITAITTENSDTVTVNTLLVIYKGMYITIDGESGYFLVNDVINDTLILNRNTSNTGSGLTVNYYNATWSDASEFYL